MKRPLTTTFPKNFGTMQCVSAITGVAGKIVFGHPGTMNMCLHLGVCQLQGPHRLWHPLWSEPRARSLIGGHLWIAVVQWLASGTVARVIQIRFLSDWLLHQDDNRGRHSVN